MNQAKPSKEADLCRVAKLWEAEIGKGQKIQINLTKTKIFCIASKILTNPKIFAKIATLESKCP
ncbi:MAG TPA: hypothetical protein DIW23_00795 [Anaerolineae bacterium]|nr:hypothetical protein [Anaerolineae bacterium]HRJ74676.1 hypothetical protein [Anaerolineales bacterium]